MYGKERKMYGERGMVGAVRGCITKKLCFEITRSWSTSSDQYKTPRDNMKMLRNNLKISNQLCVRAEMYGKERKMYGERGMVGAVRGCITKKLCFEITRSWSTSSDQYKTPRDNMKMLRNNLKISNQLCVRKCMGKRGKCMGKEEWWGLLGAASPKNYVLKLQGAGVPPRTNIKHLGTI